MTRDVQSHPSTVVADVPAFTAGDCNLPTKGLDPLVFLGNLGQYAYDLAGSNFSYTNLSEYDFTNANLKKANFTSALLTDTNFTGANLTRADFRGAYIDHTIFTDTNLTGVKGRAVIDNYIRVYGVADIIMELNPSLTSAEAEKRAMKIDILGLSHEYMESDLEAADGAQLPDLVIDSVVISEIIYAPPLN